MKNPNLWIVFLLLLSSQNIEAQSRATDDDRSFRPVFSLGMDASQIDGDVYSGYHKIGAFAGFGVNRKLSKRWEGELALTFIEKGVRKNVDSAALANNNVTFSLIRLEYLEIPFVLRYSYRKFKAEGGAALGYLLKNPPSSISQNGAVIDNNFHSFDYSFIIGLGYKVAPNVLLNLRFEYSLVTMHPYYTSTVGIFHGQFPRNLFNYGLYNNVLVLSLNYKLPVKAPDGSGNK